MQLFRLLVRMKVFQLVGIAALAVPINTFLATGHVASTQAVMASALVMGAGVASGALWFYSRRYVGELALLSGSQPGQPPRLRISVLDFWGKREDNDVALQALVPPLQHLPESARRAMLQEPLLPLDVEGDRQYFLSVRYGKVVDPAMLHALLTGQLEGQQLSAD
ncbi:hypothetical protein CHLNCDRAFT_142712 [Chlorella variabilis]|uniref:Transmembrane protein 186 n=1 Tax=Chlorella variabilis TaxID=554065 RepID=E1Z8J5_CHLVA|nr:hypothetical protein CHLNCDRAFT_142712 [Chlorella variabilis]EFN57347.1 hypothetical protein CHLNCDRAFT_142712 [Chlorella variabilis]|eukprot:XP_005849449.1 hypothetical protein CHLNCDRAFT_142712 [Chlorella variabilis]